MKTLLILLLALSLSGFDVTHLKTFGEGGYSTSSTPHTEVESTNLKLETAIKAGITTHKVKGEYNVAKTNNTEYIDYLADYTVLMDPYNVLYTDVILFGKVKKLYVDQLSYDEESLNGGIVLRPTILKGAIQYRFSYGYDRVLEQTIMKNGVLGGYINENKNVIWKYSVDWIEKEKQESEELYKTSFEVKIDKRNSIILKYAYWKNSFYWYDRNIVAYKIYLID